jgi:hypothetical protein
MSDPQFDIERATNGLVLALYLAAAVFLAVMLYFVLRDVAERQQAAEEDASSVRLVTPPTHDPQRTGAMHGMSAASLSYLSDA